MTYCKRYECSKILYKESAEERLYYMLNRHRLLSYQFTVPTILLAKHTAADGGFVLWLDFLGVFFLVLGTWRFSDKEVEEREKGS